MKIVTFLKESGSLEKGVHETIKMKQNNNGWISEYVIRYISC